MASERGVSKSFYSRRHTVSTVRTVRTYLLQSTEFKEFTELHSAKSAHEKPTFDHPGGGVLGSFGPQLQLQAAKVAVLATKQKKAAEQTCSIFFTSCVHSG